jgi:transposase-like protein
MFNPPRCPNRNCRFHLSPAADKRWFARHGQYQPLCRPHPVPRFRCLGCRRRFSRQTFRMDYRDHRPDLNPKLFELLASGVGLRQSSRLLGLSLRCLELKVRKIARHLRRLNLNLQAQLPAWATLQFDELETFEGMRTLRPLTVPLLIERNSRFIIWAESAPIPPRHRKTRHGKTRLEERRKKGRRRDGSRRACRRTLGRAAALARNLGTIGIETDEKRSYPSLIRAAFGAEHGIAHDTTKSTRIRDVSNPLFPINQTEAMARDLMGRLRRQSWLVSKKRRYLDLGLALFIAWRNLVRRRFNYDECSAAEVLGFTPRRMTEEELCSWRQDWGRRSIHPLSWNAESIESYSARRVQRAG